MKKTVDLNYTQMAEAIVQAGIPLYCVEDVKKEIALCKRAKGDHAQFHIQRLKKMCGDIKIDVTEVIKKPEVLDAELPTRKELGELLLSKLYDVYEKVPTASDYMERLIYRLAPEYRGDSIRVAILKKFLAGSVNGCKELNVEEFVNWYIENSPYRDDCAKKTLKEKTTKVINAVNDDVFDALVKASEVTDIETMGLILKHVEKRKKKGTVIFEDGVKKPYSDLRLSDKTMEAIDSFIKEHNLNSADSVADKVNVVYTFFRDNNLTEEARIIAPMIESDFKLQMKNIGPKEYKNNYKSGTEKSLKDEKKKSLKLLEVCDELAGGKFKTTNGMTRLYLYYFAMMFDMTCSIDGENFDEQRDIEKNLFGDYYSDNIVRFLSEEYVKDASNYEKEPIGDGLNYKNFVEAIMLYYLCNKELYETPGERIDAAMKTVDKCAETGAKIGKVHKDLPKHTYGFKNAIFKVLRSLKEDEVADFVAVNYIVVAVKGESKLSVASDTVSAAELLDESMSEVVDIYSIGAVNRIKEDLQDLLDEEFFDADSDVRKKAAREMVKKLEKEYSISFDWKLSRLCKTRHGDDERFIKILEKIEERFSRDYGMFSDRENEIAATLLHALYHRTKNGVALSKYMLKNAINDVTVTDKDITAGITNLEKMGFSIVCEDDRYAMTERTYDDEELNEILETLRTKSYVTERALEALFDKAKKEIEVEKRIPRTKFMALYVNEYINQIDDSWTFEELYKDFVVSVNEKLEDARYQKFNIKNLVDIYILLSLYFYQFENR